MSVEELTAETKESKDEDRWSSITMTAMTEELKVASDRAFTAESERNVAVERLASIEASHHALTLARDENAAKILELRDKIWDLEAKLIAAETKLHDAGNSTGHGDSTVGRPMTASVVGSDGGITKQGSQIGLEASTEMVLMNKLRRAFGNRAEEARELIYRGATFNEGRSCLENIPMGMEPHPTLLVRQTVVETSQPPNQWQNDIFTLMRVLDQNPPISPGPENFAEYPFELRANLIVEEALEFAEACGFAVTIPVPFPGHGETVNVPFRVTPKNFKLRANQAPNHVEMIDAIVDTMVVAIGAAVAYGLDLQPFWDEVQRANLAKANGPLREDGKRLKPEGWTPPDIRRILFESLHNRIGDNYVLNLTTKAAGLAP